MNLGSKQRTWSLLALGICLGGCDGWELFQSEETLPTSEPFRLSILNTESCPLPKELDPKKVVIHSFRVKLKGGHPEGVPANYFYASILATDGSRYLADYAGCKPLLAGDPLYPGEVAEGYLNFPLPPSATPEKLVYAPELTGKPIGSGLVELALIRAESENTEEQDKGEER